MFPNNQSKTKQIKSIPLTHSSKLKKISYKDSRLGSQTKVIHHDITSKQKSKAHKTKQQFQIHSKSKQKNKQAKVIQQQYYIQQKKTQKIKKGFQQNLLKKSKSNSKCIQIHQFQSKNLDKEDNGYKNNKEIQNINKIHLPQFRNVITFQGKIIKMPPKGYNQSSYHNFTSISGYQETGSQPQINTDRFRDKKIKIRSKQKLTKNIISKSGQKKKIKRGEKHYKSQQNIIAQVDFHKKNFLVQQTQITPLKQKEYQRHQKFDFKQIYELVQQDLKACAEIKINSNVVSVRKQCIKFMSEICGQIPLRRQTFYLAISIFDRTNSKKILIDNYKLLALVSLTLSMKLEQARRAEQFVHILGIVNSGKQSYLQSISSCKSSSKPKSISHRSQKSNVGSQSNKKWKPSKISIKQQNVKKISISGIAKILKKYNCSKIGRQEFMTLEQKVTIYLRFRLWRIQAIFWADLLTCLWDQHISTNYQDVHENSHLFFRCSYSLTNIAYLYQILQMAYMHQNVYNYPSIYIVLSAIYLLVRITKQNNENGYEYYRESLATSTNILFVDKTGINQIYWLFLQKIKIQMVQILSCCQFISNFLQPSLLKNYISNNQQFKDTIDNNLSLHQFNPDLYLNIY